MSERKLEYSVKFHCNYMSHITTKIRRQRINKEYKRGENGHASEYEQKILTSQKTYWEEKQSCSMGVYLKFFWRHKWKYKWGNNIGIPEFFCFANKIMVSYLYEIGT